MTIDDNSSIYVGGLPYDWTEDELRRDFEVYGAIVDVKLIHDRGIRGKCYGFITFTSPRSAVDAINTMDGKTIGGRVVKVNEVKTRGPGGRYYGHESYRRNERDMDRHRHYRDHSREYERETGRRYELDHRDDRTRAHLQDRDGDQGRDAEETELRHSRSHGRQWERDRDVDFEQDRRADRVVDHDVRGDVDRDQVTKRRSRSSSYDRQSRELSSGSSDYHQMDEQLESLLQRREELRKEKSEMEEILGKKKQVIADLQRSSVKLEGSLISVKKLSSQRQVQLTKLHKCFSQVKEYGERLKISEQELQAVAESVMKELDAGADGHLRDSYLTNGKV